MKRAPALTGVAAAGCVLVWMLVPMLLDQVGLGALDLPARVACVFVFLSGLNCAYGRWLHD